MTSLKLVTMSSAQVVVNNNIFIRQREKLAKLIVTSKGKLSYHPDSFDIVLRGDCLLRLGSFGNEGVVGTSVPLQGRIMMVDCDHEKMAFIALERSTQRRYSMDDRDSKIMMDYNGEIIINEDDSIVLNRLRVWHPDNRIENIDFRVYGNFTHNHNEIVIRLKRQ